MKTSSLAVAFAPVPFLFEKKPKTRHVKLNPTNVALSCDKQHKNIEKWKLQFNEQNIVISFCPSLCLLRAYASSVQLQMFFQFLDTVLCNILNVASDYLCSCIKSRL